MKIKVPIGPINRYSGMGFLVASLNVVLAVMLYSSSVAAAEATNDLLFLPAVQSRLASQSILNDVVNTGKRLVVVGERGHILVSDDNGETWRQVEVPTSVTLTAVVFPTPDKGWVVGHDGVVLHSADGGLSWVKQLDGSQINAALHRQVEELLQVKKAERAAASDPDRLELLEFEVESLQFFANDARMALEEGASRPFMDLWFKNEWEGIIVGSFGMVFKTEDGGQSWQPIVDRIENMDGYHYYAIDSAGENLFLVGERGLLFRSGDGGNSWQRLEAPYDGSFFGVAGRDGGDLVVIFGLRGNAFVSYDRGDNWQAVDIQKGAALSGAVFQDDGSLLMISNDGRLVKSTDDGKTFQFLPVRVPGGIALAESNTNNVICVGLLGAHKVPKLSLED